MDFYKAGIVYLQYYLNLFPDIPHRMTDLQLYTEFSTLPLPLRKEVADFVAFLKQKTRSERTVPERTFGAAKGFFKMRDDFDEPLADFEEYM